MLDFYQKRKLRAIANSRITQGVLGLLVLFFGWQAFERYQVAADTSARLEAVAQEAAALQARKVELEAQVQYLEDERGIEAEMRRQFDIALPGEEVVVILEEEVGPEIKPLSTSTNQESSGWWPW